jgi:tetratricopeptide (TPR) repeat protein
VRSLSMRRIRIERVRWAALLVGCGLLAGVALAPASLRADEGSERAVARQHFAKGVALAKQRAYAKALNEFQQAYAAVPHFSVLYNIGQAEIALGQSAEAVATLQRYLDEGGAGVDAKRRAEVQAVIEREREKAAPPEPAPTPAASASAAPAPVLAPAPVASLPVAPSPPAAPAPLSAGDRRAPAASAAKARRLSSVSARRGHSHPAKASSAGRRTLAYVVAGAGVALSAAAFVHYSWNRGRYQQWQGERDDYFHDPTEPNRASANELSESIDNASAVTVVLGIGAGVALGTGTVLWLSSGAPGSDPQKRGMAPFLSAQGTF